jgi:hypothetical protein
MAIYVYSEATGLFTEYEPVKAVVDPAVGFVSMAEAWVASDGQFFPLWPIKPPSAPLGTLSIAPTWNTTSNRYEFQIAWSGGGLYVTSWEVQRRQYSGDTGPGPFTTIATPAAATLTYTELDGFGQQRYGYKIRGIGQAGVGPYSNEVIVDTLPQLDPGAYPAIDDPDGLVSNPAVGFDNGQPSWQIRVQYPYVGAARSDLAPYIFWPVSDVGLALRTPDGVAHQIDSPTYMNDSPTVSPYYLQKGVVFDVPATFPWSSDVVVEAKMQGFVNGEQWTRVIPHTYNLGGPGLPAAPAAVGVRHFAGVYRIEWWEVANASSYVVTVNDLTTASVAWGPNELAQGSVLEVSPGFRRYDFGFGAVVGHNYQATVAAKNVAGTSAGTLSNGSIKIANPIDFIPPLRQTWDSASGWIGQTDGFMYQGYAFAMDYAVGMFGAFPISQQIGPAAIGYLVTCTYMQVFGKTIAGGVNNPSLTGLVLHKTGSQFESFDAGSIIGGHREYTTQNVPFALAPPTNYGDILIQGASNGYRGIAFWAPETSPQPGPHFQAHDKNSVIFSPDIVPLTVRIYHDG